MNLKTGVRPWLLSLMLASFQAHGHEWVFAFAEDEAPVSYTEEDRTTGSLPDITRILFEFLPEHDVKMVALPWPRAQRMVASGSADGFVTYPSEERKQYAHFTEDAAYYIDYGYLIYHRDNPAREQLENARSFDDLRGLTFIGQNSAQWERENIPDFLDTTLANSLDAMIHLLLRRQVGDFIVMPPEQAIYLAKQHGYRSQMVFRQVDFIPNSRIPFHVGVSKALGSAEDFVESVDQILASEAFKAQRQALIREYRR